MTKYLCISSYIRKPFLIYYFATDPIWISLYLRKIFFSFLSVYKYLVWIVYFPAAMIYSTSKSIHYCTTQTRHKKSFFNCFIHENRKHIYINKKKIYIKSDAINHPLDSYIKTTFDFSFSEAHLDNITHMTDKFSTLSRCGYFFPWNSRFAITYDSLVSYFSSFQYDPNIFYWNSLFHILFHHVYSLKRPSFYKKSKPVAKHGQREYKMAAGWYVKSQITWVSYTHPPPPPIWKKKGLSRTSRLRLVLFSQTS